jgi:viroplasmin and RNaseH domain-containing protein
MPIMGKGGPKFYAVRKGYTTGIFRDWASCERAVKGFPGAEFKSFPNQQQAQNYLAKAGGGGGQAFRPPQPQQQQVQQQQQRGYSTATIGAAAAAAPSGGKFFAIVAGHQTGVFEGTWEQIKPLVIG